MTRPFSIYGFLISGIYITRSWSLVCSPQLRSKHVTRILITLLLLNDVYKWSIKGLIKSRFSCMCTPLHKVQRYRIFVRNPIVRGIETDKLSIPLFPP
ncbi:hypothetical protein GALMADRAFT_797868 [Galerina marginata CBS 339.88]|uniref:Uncharacterized protein n=1 Tax=Galerina marginata (strain CBS 339.88) TaxID=685588 RepID=A0A067SK63_GALM3|nr:hypothetical protein GALMADRAFT_797868 [Galerina marginata CBS 339.88]